MNIYSEVSCIKGVGPKISEDLNKCMIFNILDLLLYIPRDYEYISNCTSIKGLNLKNKVMINCTAVRINKDIRTKTGKILSTVVFNDNDRTFQVKWFNQPYIKNSFKIGEQYFLMGKIEQYKNENFLINPAIIKNNDLINTAKAYEKIIPIYPLKGSIKNKILIKLIHEVLNEVKINENLPKWIVEKYNFYSLDKAIRAIHEPQSSKDLNEARRRLKFQELFSYSLKVLMLKDYIDKKAEGIAFLISPELTILKEKLPFNLTQAQSRVIREILIDEKKNKPTNRLIQGDVGSGKTIVAIIALFNVIMNGFQAVMMAPTEILANQHFNEATMLLKEFNINIELLTGSTPQKRKSLIKEGLKDGKIQLIIGTHALIEDDVVFNNLGMVVTDEQHRFGVTQRSKLFNKGKNVDVLVMTATPIPRTLSLYLYGDLDVSIIDELPPGRKKVETYYVKKEENHRVYNFTLKEIQEGRQVYIVCPLVAESEELDIVSVEEKYNELKERYYKNVEVEILHGKMAPKLKEEIMARFKKGETKVLISTTVIEVGINVPNATIMIIENAERFGLAQLHQLRGRVGRGQHKSYCILVCDVKNDIIRKRMEIMQSSNDGFFIAEEDLKIRGSGEIFGHRQHGDDGLILSDVIEDIALLKEASLEAKKLLNSSDSKDVKIREEILKKLEQSSKFICFN